jgi:hypothetical protein
MIAPGVSTLYKILITVISIPVADFILKELCCSYCSSVGQFVVNLELKSFLSLIGVRRY